MCKMGQSGKQVKYLIVDTTAFLQNAQLQEVAENAVTCKEVVDEILDKRQLRRLVVLPYDLKIKNVFSENIQLVSSFAKKTGDYNSLSATDIKVIALTYQLEKEHVGVAHIRTDPIVQRTVNFTKERTADMQADVTGFFMPHEQKLLEEKFDNLHCEDDLKSNDQIVDDILAPVVDDEILSEDHFEDDLKSNDQIVDDILAPVVDDEILSEDDDGDDSGWITPSNITLAKKQIQSAFTEEKQVTVACMTTDFAMQNVLKQMNLNVAALDGLMIKQLRTFILRCYACFKTTSIMTKQFCPNCGHNTLKKVAVSLDEEGNTQIHINAKRPLTARGKKFSLPRMKGGKHPNNPVLVADHPMPQNRVSKLARTKLNPLDDDYIAGFSPFAMRDVTSRSAQLGIKPQDMKHWMRKNPNEARRKRK